jgi:surfeit locus 1 family protein
VNAPVAQRKRGIVEPTIFTVVSIAILFGLGNWQLERKVWKDSLIATTTARFSAAPVTLPPRERWPRLDQNEIEFLRVTFPAEFMNEQEALVYTAGSAFRSDITGPGFWVFTPVRLAGGSVIVVNRGYIPYDRKDPKTRPQSALTGLVDVVGVMRWSEKRGMFTPPDEPQNNIWHLRNPQVLAAAKSWGPVAPFYIDMEQPQVAGGLPRVGALTVKLPNNHLQYAFTWFGLAGALACVYLAWLLARRRG